ncbi:MAG: hypothetical protein HZA78_04320, partial [Candidatus Schekmanbacteria bacterium]|nr:hypothetical protein [Candidatus Schekmanbacteria bacterium]
MERKYYILFSLLLIAVFSAKDILLLGSKTWPHLYPVINTSPLTFEEVYCYLPFLNRFSWATPLPAAPMVNPGLSQFTFFPALSLITQGIILKWLCFSNPDVYLFISHFLFPLISFWLLFVIYRKFIAAPWALLFAFWG